MDQWPALLRGGKPGMASVACNFESRAVVRRPHTLNHSSLAEASRDTHASIGYTAHHFHLTQLHFLLKSIHISSVQRRPLSTPMPVHQPPCTRRSRP